MTLSLVSLVVPDYDEAIAYYVSVLGFRLVEDTRLSADRRWVVVSPGAAPGCSLLLAKAKNDRERAAIGNQTGGRVFLFLATDDFTRDYQAMLAKGVRFLEEPRKESYGQVVVFADPFGNKWDLLQLRAPGTAT